MFVYHDCKKNLKIHFLPQIFYFFTFFKISNFLLVYCEYKKEEKLFGKIIQKNMFIRIKFLCRCNLRI